MNAQRESFDRYYEADSEYYGTVPSPHLLACVDVLRVDARDSAIAIDIGGGEGRDGRWLAALGFSAVCVDTSFAGLRAARTVGLRVCQGSILALPCRSASASVLNATTVIDHVGPQDAAIAVDEIRRVLIPGGIVALEVFTTSDPACVGGPVSDTASFVKHYYEPNELRGVLPEAEVIYYAEGVEPDWSHGSPHSHGVARLVARVGR